VLGLLCAGGSATLAAQTDYYNTSVGRPLRIEDAAPVEYRAIELDVAPLRFEGARGARRWSLHPETTIGILPRTQLQLAIPLTYRDRPSDAPRGVSGIEISALHAFNAETSIPALAISADVLLPVGPLGGDATYGTVKGIMTRTLPWARFHLNAQYSAGPTASVSDRADSRALDGADVSRWLAGLAVDKTFPLHSLLVSAESFAEQPIVSGAPVAWTAGTGVRYQLAPRWAMDAGFGRRFTGEDRSWFATLGSAYGFGLR
jgi:hypothetical protein